ncbi:hypothetical protein T484DRAFT_1758242, partial [Baffinella frigidus]
MRAAAYAKLDTAARYERNKQNNMAWKDKRAAYDKKYRVDNGDKRRAWEKAYRAKNKEKIKQQYQKWRSLHPSYHIDKRANDPVYKLAKNTRCRLESCMRAWGFKKASSTQKLLGCTWQQGVDHLDGNDRGLKMSDQGVHIDHIRPLSSFNLHCKVEQTMANNWCNLQLLPAVENLQKGADFNYDAWSITDAGRMLLALECELRAAAANA